MLAGKNHGLFVFFPLSQADQPLPVSKTDVKKAWENKTTWTLRKRIFYWTRDVAQGPIMPSTCLDHVYV